MFSKEEIQTASFLKSLERNPLRALATYPFGCRTVEGATAYQTAALAKPEQAAVALKALRADQDKNPDKVNSPFAVPLIKRIIEQYPLVALKVAEKEQASQAAGEAESTVPAATAMETAAHAPISNGSTTAAHVIPALAPVTGLPDIDLGALEPLPLAQPVLEDQTVRLLLAEPPEPKVASVQHMPANTVAAFKAAAPSEEGLSTIERMARRGPAGPLTIPEMDPKLEERLSARLKGLTTPIDASAFRPR